MKVEYLILRQLLITNSFITKTPIHSRRSKHTNWKMSRHKQSRPWHAFPLLLFSIFFVQIYFTIIISSYRCSAQNIPRFSAILVFGDSAVDPGNNNYITTIAKGNHAPDGINFPGKISTGRFSDGKLVPDLLASMLGLKETIPPFLQPKLSDQELLTGVSFASAAAGFDDETFASKHNSNVQATTIS